MCLVTPASNPVFSRVQTPSLSPVCYPSCNTCISLDPFDTVINFAYDSIINLLQKRLDNKTFLSRESWFIKKACLTLPAMEQTTGKMFSS